MLRPGGVLVASTFLKVAAPLGAVFGDDVVRPLNQVQSCCGEPCYAGYQNTLTITAHVWGLYSQN